MPKIKFNSSAFERAFISGLLLMSSQTCHAHAAPDVMPVREMHEKLHKASALYHDSKWNPAIKLYSEILITHPNDLKVRVDRGVCYCRINEYQKALDDFNYAIKMDPKSSRALQHRSYAYYQLGKYENTVADSSKAISLNSSNRYAYRDRARAYAKLGKFELAQKDFEIQKKMFKVAADYSVGMELEHKGQLSAALRIFQNSAKQVPGMYNPNYRRACIYTKVGLYNEAVKTCTEMIKDHPATYEGRRLRAINYLQIGELDKAVADADIALKTNPNDVDPYYVKARVAADRKNYAEAIKNYSVIIKLQPSKELPARMERAEAYAALGQYEHAVADYDFLANAEKNDETIYHHRASAYLKMHNYEKAIADLQKFVQLSPKDTLALMSLGDGLVEAHRYAEAVDAYNKAIGLDATSPTLFEHRAKAKENCKDLEGAEKDRQQAKHLRDSD